MTLSTSFGKIIVDRTVDGDIAIDPIVTETFPSAVGARLWSTQLLGECEKDTQ